MKTILVVDDEKDVRDSLGAIFKDEGYAVVKASSGEEALKALESRVFDLVLLDIWLPNMDGVETLEKIKSRGEEVPVIMISGHANIETAVKTTRLGAYDFIEKPLSLDKVLLTAEHAMETRLLKAENTELRRKTAGRYELIGASQAMEGLRMEIERAAPSNGWVLITGENGTGKEFVARNIHMKSARSSKPFIEVNCAAIPEELIESELFGHEKGAFTGAVSQKRGRFDLADKGTIFLDEIGDMSLKTQAKVLRILQEQSFERVGGTETIRVDVRVIAATNKDLKALMDEGKFREDLYYRLSVIPLHVPPLRERRDDVAVFFIHFLSEFSRETGRRAPVPTDAAIDLLSSYRWPGNVRELKNLAERLVIMTRSSSITPDDLPAHIKGARQAGPDDLFTRVSFREARMEFEKEFIRRKLKEFDSNVVRTAEALGIERSHLYRKMKAYGIET